jgi:hypothetical protein
VDHLRGRVGGPRHHGDGGRIGLQDHVAVGAGDGAVVARIFGWIVAGHGHAQHRFRDAHAALLREFTAREDLPARHAGQVGHQAFDFCDALLVQPQVHVGVGKVFANCHLLLSLLLSGAL